MKKVYGGLITIVLAMMVVAGIGASASPAGATQIKNPHKVYVCKYVGTPGVDEVLQGVIEVDANSVAGNPVWDEDVYGITFNDAQTHSFVIGWVGTKDVELPVLGIEDCPPPVSAEETEASFEVVQPNCDNEGTADIILGNTDEVSYEIEGDVAPGETVTVTANAKEGFVLVGDDEFEVTFDDFNPEDCEVPLETEASVAAVQPDCENEAALILGNEDSVEYSVEGTIAPGETVSVTAEAKEGFVLVGESEFEITFDSFDADSCENPPPPQPDTVPAPEQKKVVKITALPHTL